MCLVGAAGEGGEPWQLGIHGAMEMGGNTPCSGYSGYPYNNRRLDDEDGWQRYEEGLPGGADGAYYPTMVWLVVLTFVYVRRTCRLLGRCFASEHKARRKKLIVARGTRSAFGLVRFLVVLLFYICGMGTGSRDGHFVGGNPERACISNFCGGLTLAAGRHGLFSHFTITGRASLTRRGMSQHFESARRRRGISTPRCFSTEDRSVGGHSCTGRRLGVAR